MIIEWGASPETRFALLAPSAYRRPLPFECRFSISLAFFGLFETNASCRSFSHQRKPGMSQFEPCRIPDCIAPVCDDQSHSHSIIEWEPLRSQPAIVGALPSRIARTSTSCARPSISRNSTPGTSLGAAASFASRACRLITSR